MVGRWRGRNLLLPYKMLFVPSGAATFGAELVLVPPGPLGSLMGRLGIQRGSSCGWSTSPPKATIDDEDGRTDERHASSTTNASQIRLTQIQRAKGLEGTPQAAKRAADSLARP